MKVQYTLLMPYVEVQCAMNMLYVCPVFDKNRHFSVLQSFRHFVHVWHTLAKSARYDIRYMQISQVKKALRHK